MSSLYFRPGTTDLLNTSGGLAASTDCCCGGGGTGDCPAACADTPPATISAFIDYTAEDGTVGDFCPPNGVPCDLARGQTFVQGLVSGATKRDDVNTGSSAGSCTSEANSLDCGQEWFYSSGLVDYCSSAYSAQVAINTFIVKLPDGTFRIGALLKLSILFTISGGGSSMEISLLSGSLGTSPLSCSSLSGVTLNEVCRNTVGGLNCGIGPVTMTVNP